MSIGLSSGKHSFDALINQDNKTVTPINPFDKNALSLVKAPGLKALILTTHKAFLDQFDTSGMLLLLWKVDVEYKYFGLRTTVVVRPSNDY